MMTEELQWDIVGKDILRREDEWFLRGAGRFLDDLPEPRDLIHLGFVGSVHAHARILSIDTRAAQALPGVIDVLTGADFTDLIGPVRPDIDIAGYKDAPRRVVAVDKVRFVGESVAVILAETPYIAQDAIELVEVEYDPLPPVPDPDAGVAADAALIHEGLEDNLLFQSQFKTDGFDAIFDAADLVLSEEFRTGRVAGVPIEPRGCMAILDHVADSVTLWTTTQIPHLARTIIANALDMPESKLRVVLPSVGGGFGTKAQIYPDEFIAVALARKLGRAVKWVQDRREELLTNIHSRHHIYRIDVAVNSDAVIQAVRVDFTTDSGAYSSCPYGCTLETTGGARMLPGPYRIRNYAYHIRSVATTTAPVGVYRGVAQPSCFFTIEGMMDRIGRKLGVDPAEVRRRNIIRPEELPYVNVVGVRYDTGSYLPSLERALEIIGYEDFRKRQPVERLVDGKYRGIGICNFTEVSGTGAPGWRARGLAKVPGFDSALVKVEPDGKGDRFHQPCRRRSGTLHDLCPNCRRPAGRALGRCDHRRGRHGHDPVRDGYLRQSQRSYWRRRRYPGLCEGCREDATYCWRNAGGGCTRHPFERWPGGSRRRAGPELELRRGCRDGLLHEQPGVAGG